MQTNRRLTLPLVLMALLALVLAAWAGLVRMGWALPPVRPGLAADHGPLMALGFLGTLLSLERAVAMAALGRRWAFAAPVLAALGALGLLVGLPAPVPPALMLLASLITVAIFAEIIRRQPEMFGVLMGLGTVLWAAGNALWLAGQPVFNTVWWWGGWLVLTIAGERLELTRLLRLSRAGQAALLALLAVFLAGLLLISFAGVPDLGTRVAGAALLGLAVWFLRYDIARRTVRRTGLTRFIAVNLLAGYGWLAVCGLLALVFGRVTAGLRYDAVLHTLFLGFVFGIIFGHAPVIFPAVLRIEMKYSPAFYVHVSVLHLSLLLRIFGDVAGLPALRQWGGMFNFVALLLFLIVTARSALLGSQGKPSAADRSRKEGKSVRKPA